MTITRPAHVDPVTAAVNEAIGWVHATRVGDDAARDVGANSDFRIGVACSGGADSIALAHATMGAIGAERVVVIHIDHQLSPGSDAVALAVATWARGQGATAIVRAVAVGDRASLEAAARDARYAAFADIADELELSTIFVGHTARDQAETVLMRILRGTGPAGLVGIPRTRLAHAQCGIVRPLLGVSRVDIDAYVARHQLPTWVDPMNNDRSLFRVRVREEVLPALRRENPQLDAALVRLATSAGEWLDAIDAIATPFARAPIDCAKLAAQPVAIRKRAVAIALERAGVDYEAVHLDAVDSLITRPSGGQLAIDLPDARVVRTYDRLEIAHAAANEAASETRDDTGLVAPDGYELRRWQPGDRMRPARLAGRSRKLSDLFVDAKIPRDVRSQARVVVRRDGVIVWAEHLGLAHGETENVAPRPPE
jgi:tRNA(Ile)-lysidine synthase